MFQAYPQMLYHPDGRKQVARDEQHHSEMAREGFCAIDDEGKMIPVDGSCKAGNAFDEKPEPPISEAVRDLADYHGVDWRAIEGTGKEGRVLKSDILKYVDDHQNG